MTRAIPHVVITFLEKEEVPIMRVYDDKRPRTILKPGQKVLGKLTAGVGHTGADLTIGMTVTQDMVDAWLAADLQIAVNRLRNKVGDKIIADMTDNQYAAMLSFVFNLGTPGTGIWTALKNRQWDSVPSEMVKFVYWEGKKSEGLVNRRNAEVALWSKREPGNHPVKEAPPSSITRDAATPPAPTTTVPLHQQPAFLTAATTAVGGAGAAALPVVQGVTGGVKQIADAVGPYADKSDHVAGLYSILISALAGLAALAVVLLWLKHNHDKKAVTPAA